MLAEDIRKIEGSRKQCREFGLLIGGVCVVLAALLAWRGRPAWGAVGSVGILLIALGVTAPMILRRLYKIWMSCALVMGWVMTRVILGVLFYGVVSPIAVLTRMTGKHYLDLSFRTGDASYWKLRTKQPERTDYERQF